jgi:hypothetical protein
MNRKEFLVRVAAITGIPFLRGDYLEESGEVQLDHCLVFFGRTGWRLWERLSQEIALSDVHFMMGGDSVVVKSLVRTIQPRNLLLLGRLDNRALWENLQSLEERLIWESVTKVSGCFIQPYACEGRKRLDESSRCLKRMKDLGISVEIVNPSPVEGMSGNGPLLRLSDVLGDDERHMAEWVVRYCQLQAEGQIWKNNQPSGTND